MASNVSGQPPVGSPPHEQRGGEERPERYGTILVEHRRKDDGRALILYSHAEDDPA
jgi:hypothetical protein